MTNRSLQISSPCAYQRADLLALIFTDGQAARHRLLIDYGAADLARSTGLFSFQNRNVRYRGLAIWPGQCERLTIT